MVIGFQKRAANIYQAQLLKQLCYLGHSVIAEFV
jgi:hypothetical protein